MSSTPSYILFAPTLGIAGRNGGCFLWDDGNQARRSLFCWTTLGTYSTSKFQALFVGLTTSSWYLQLLLRSCMDWWFLDYRTLPWFLHALFAGSCRKGFVPLVTVLAVPRHEGHALLDFDYQFLLCRLWTVDIFLLATSLSLRFVPVVLVHLLLHTGSVPGCSLSSLCRSPPEWLKLRTLSPCVKKSVFSKNIQRHSNILLHGQDKSLLFKSVTVVVCKWFFLHFACCQQTMGLSFFATLIHTCFAEQN